MIKLYSYYLKAIEVMYSQVFNNPGDPTYITSFMGSGFLIFQFAFFNELFGFFGNNLSIPKQPEGVILVILLITFFNYLLIKKASILNDVQVSKLTSVLVFLYFFLATMITYFMYVF